jgi:glutathione S-transferase
MAPQPGTPQRASYYRWLFFVGSAFEPALVERMMRKDAAPLAKMAAGWGSYDDVIDTIEGALEGREVLVGDRFTAADLYMVSSLSWGGLFGAPRIKESPAIQAYLGRHTQRPAFARAMGG